MADDAALQRLLEDIKRGKPEIQRFKGLGEMMPETLKATTLDSKKRQLVKVVIHDPLATERTISDLMGEDAQMPKFGEDKIEPEDLVDLSVFLFKQRAPKATG